MVSCDTLFSKVEEIGIEKGPDHNSKSMLACFSNLRNSNRKSSKTRLQKCTGFPRGRL